MVASLRFARVGCVFQVDHGQVDAVTEGPGASVKVVMREVGSARSK